MANKVCKHCKLQSLCDDLPGFCLMLPYVGVVSTVFLVIYFILNSDF